jgi:hypothetical protein
MALEHRYRVLRFWNNEVLENIEGVWDTIFAATHAATAPPPPPHTPPPSPRTRGEGVAKPDRGIKPD